MQDVFKASGSSPTVQIESQPDFLIENHGSIFLLRPLTPAASSWIEEHLSEDRQIFGDAVAVEARFIPLIVIGAQGDGLTVAR